MIKNTPRPIVRRPVDLINPQRQDALKAMHCIAPPFGCGGLAVEFSSQKCLNEYWISGLCQACQDKIFGGDDGR